MRSLRCKRGGVTVELAIALPAFLLGMCIVVEAARVLYMVSTLAEASRRAIRAAVVVDFTDATALDQLRRRAMFNSNTGQLPYGAPFTANHLQVSYLAADGATTVSPMPTCPEMNHANCTADPYGASCIRFVRVRVCQPGGNTTCTPVQYQPLLDVGGFFQGLPMPRFESIAPVESLGFNPGAPSSCS